MGPWAPSVLHSGLTERGGLLRRGTECPDAKPDASGPNRPGLVNVLNLAALLWQPLWCQWSRAANNSQVLQLGDKILPGTNTETQNKEPQGFRTKQGAGTFKIKYILKHCQLPITPTF